MKETQDIFPSKLATGAQFCNRLEERKKLSSNIQKSRHTVLISPRRYGKSSLVHYVLAELKLPFASIDLFLAYDDKAVTRRLLDGISAAISRMMPPEEKALEKIRSFFTKFKTSLHLGAFQIELSYDRGEIDAADQIYSALQALSDLAAREKKKVIIFIDEFQDIASAQTAKSIQGAIRHVAQATDHLMFIFSGSNRHLLLELFDDKSMPLYMLCDKIYLERMSSQDYTPHLQKIAKKTWGEILPEMVLTRLFTLTELHPFYINFLSHQVWQSKELPTIQTIETCWEICLDEETRRIRAEIEKLNKNQQNILKTLAIEPTQEPTGKAFSDRSGAPTSSLHQTIKVLFEKDMVFEVSQLDPCVSIFKIKQIRVMDPLMAYYLKRLF